MISFTLNDEQEQLLRDWQTGHNCKYRTSCGRRDVGTFGGADSFIFIPTNVEEIVIVECACGEKLDLSPERLFFKNFRQQENNLRF